MTIKDSANVRMAPARAGCPAVLSSPTASLQAALDSLSALSLSLSSTKAVVSAAIPDGRAALAAGPAAFTGQPSLRAIGSFAIQNGSFAAQVGPSAITDESSALADGSSAVTDGPTAIADEAFLTTKRASARRVGTAPTGEKEPKHHFLTIFRAFEDAAANLTAKNCPKQRRNIWRHNRSAGMARMPTANHCAGTPRACVGTAWCRKLEVGIWSST